MFLIPSLQVGALHRSEQLLETLLTLSGFLGDHHGQQSQHQHPGGEKSACASAMSHPIYLKDLEELSGD